MVSGFNGTIKPSDHIIKNLGDINFKDLKTVKQIHSLKGLYKCLSKHLPDVSSLMTPFDPATSGKNSTD